jgi:hypothetical protein
VRAPQLHETDYFYGFGGKKYPLRKKAGVVLDEYDPSELDRRAGLTYYSNDVDGGDSGAMIYGKDGAMLGVVTWSIEDGEKVEMAGYMLNFDPEDILVAQMYDQ